MITKIDSKNIFDKNLDEQSLYKKYPQLLDILLIDRTTGNNILWATDNYEQTVFYMLIAQAEETLAKSFMPIAVCAADLAESIDVRERQAGLNKLAELLAKHNH
ncbi:hypothetical protein [Gardnerella leopoldii]|uniref:Uncharacterized protein n=1 Tax=Gardnerella vaginalis TaxID=2702 RepID=A0AAP8IUV8_GARVA|nr:hypothetical protein [Gardnerella leopoldii]PKZ60229.1 hypothetical protein CYJ61_02230 [Gardnerella vaginalis]